jgi:uncharacterized membrane protein YgcG
MAYRDRGIHSSPSIWSSWCYPFETVLVDVFVQASAPSRSASSLDQGDHHMVRRTAARAARVAIAASFLRAGVAFACPTPPDQVCTQDGVPPTACTDPGASGSGASDLNVAITTGQQKEDGKWVVNLQATRGGVCDQMVLFTLGANDVTVSLGDSEQSIPLRNVRIASVVRTSTSPSGAKKHPVRFGSGAFCVWAAEKGKNWNQAYQVNVQAFDPEGNLHQGTAAVEIDCTTTSEGATSQTAFSDNPDYCAESTACVATVELPETCSGQCQCDPDGGGSDDGSGGGGSEGECVPGGENDCGGDSGGGGSEDGGSGSGGSEGECVPGGENSCDGDSGGGGSEDGGSGGGGSEGECVPGGENSCDGDSGGGGSEDSGSGSGGSEEECIPSGENYCGGDSGGGSSAENDALTSASTQAIKGGCAAFPGAGADLGVSVLAMLGISVALRRRR